MLNKNEIYDAQIDGYTSEGLGVAHINGVAVFVPYAIVGEKCQIKIVKTKLSFAYGRLVEVPDDASEHRVVSDCPVYKRCGGCSLRHMSYNEELNFKKQKVNDALRRIGAVSADVEKIWSCEDFNRYRNNAQLPVRKGSDGQILIGMFAPRSHEVIAIDDCMLQSKHVCGVVRIVKSWMLQNNIKPYDELKGKGIVRHICVRTNNTDEVLVCVVTRKNKVENLDKLAMRLQGKLPNFVGLVQNVNEVKTNVIFGRQFKTIWGNDVLVEELCGLRFELSAGAFFQVNLKQAEVLYNRALELAELSENDTAIDLYCGTGTITLLLARRVKHAIGIELNPFAVKNAKQNALKNNIDNMEFICGDAGEVASKLLEDQQAIDVVCVDPPRKGLSNQAIETILKFRPKKIIYISCNPATLARDLKILQNGIYIEETDGKRQIRRNDTNWNAHVEAVDMFPRTPHVETICVLEKAGK